VKVLDEHFTVVKELSGSSEPTEFEQPWRGEARTQLAPAQLHKRPFKIDIEADHEGGRWLYDAEGLLVKLNKRLKPAFRIQDAQTFNLLATCPRAADAERWPS
jgi:hypothetical protein